MIKTRFIVAIGLLMTLACCSNSGTCLLYTSDAADEG